MERTGWLFAAVMTLVAAMYLVSYGAVSYRNAQAAAETRSMQQWCLSRPRAVDGRCADVLADMYRSRGPGLWTQTHE